jgi:hypothetical protein
MNDSGDFVVAWVTDFPEARLDVFGQRFDATGNPMGAEFRVNSYTTDWQIDPRVAMDDSGGFVTVWHSYGQDGSETGVFARIYDSGGLPLGGEFQVNTYTTGRQYLADVAIRGPGGFVVVWGGSIGQDGSHVGVFGQRFGPAGNPEGSEFQVNTFTSAGQYVPAVAADAAGRFVVVWHSRDQDGSGFGVFGQRFDSSGAPLGAEFQVNTHTAGYQGTPAAAMDSSGGFLVVWVAGDQDGSETGVFGQRFDAAGLPLGPEFQVNSYTTGWQYHVSLAAGESSGPVASWTTYEPVGMGREVIGRRVTLPFFSGSFEAGDACAWSAAVGGGCP